MKNLYKQVKKKIKDFRRLLKYRIRYFRARLHRRIIEPVTFIGVTGSAGKTTTTNLTAALLTSLGPCQQTHEKNTLESIVKTILKTNRRHLFCVAELAAYGPGTMDLPVRILKPDIAVVTRIGRDHYSAYKSMAAIASEKEKVLLGLSSQGTAVLNIDDPLVKAMGERCNRRIIWFGEGAGATLLLREAHSCWPEPLTMLVDYKDKTYEVRTQLHGTHMAIPVLASLGVALAADLPLGNAIQAVAEVQTPDGRMQVVTGNDGVVFIRDDWKAPHWSLDAPLEFLKEARADRKIVIVGTISDASGDATRRYKKYCRHIREFSDLVIFIGPHAHRALRARQNKDDATIQGFPSIRYAATYLQTELRKGDLVLLKGSHKADHLVRLIINRDCPIQCWTEQCDVHLFCDMCPKLYNPSPDISFATPLPHLDSQTGPAVPVVVGLGNSGTRFRHTLHNVGHCVLDTLVQAAGSIWQAQPEGWVCCMVLGGTAIYLLKPRTSINNNGAMVRRFLERMGSSPQHCIVVHDDADIALGDVRFKSKGGDAGHKGVRSVIAALGTFEIQRLRLGIGRSDDVQNKANFVLSKISADEETLLAKAIEKASAMIHERFQHHVVDEFIK
jgi:UDP-N-acetylmuramoyl-tripeptide--D-alanyl-D-alanine ligase